MLKSIPLFDPKAIYCLISLSNFTNNNEDSELANSPELKVLRGNAGKESVILPFRIQELAYKYMHMYLTLYHAILTFNNLRIETF